MRSVIHRAAIRRAALAALAMICASACVLAFGGASALAAAPEAPEVTVESISATTAIFGGVLNPNAVAPAEVGTYQFVYRPSAASECEGAGEVRVPVSPGMSLGLEHEVVAEAVAGLTADTEYAVCLAATEPGGTTLSAPVTFKTALPPEQPETKAATEVSSSTATLNGVLNPSHEGEAGTYQFVYRKSATECQGEGEQSTPATAATGSSPEPVSAEATGLLPSTAYTFCLRALNGASESALGNAVSFTTRALAPTVSEESVLYVSSGSATITGRVNPGGADTTYRFEYGLTASYGKSVPGDAGAGIEAVAVSAHPQDLTPGVLYHYRLVAGNEVDEEVAGPDQTFTTQSVGVGYVALPDGRMWELVSPSDKNGAEIGNSLYLSGLGGVMQASENGDAVTYITTVPVGTGGVNHPFDPQVLSRRAPDGWSSEDISIPHEKASSLEYHERGGGYGVRYFEGEEYQAFSPDLSLAFVAPEGDIPGEPPLPFNNGERTQDAGGYVRDNSTGTFTPTTLEPKEWYAEKLALSKPPPSCDASTSPAKGVGVDAVSDDGCYVYFNTEGGSGPLEVTHYDGREWTTTLISSLAGAVVPWGGPYLELSPNGQYLTFMSNASLTGYDNEDVTSEHPGERMDQEVYLYDAGTNRLVCPSCDPTGARPAGQLDFYEGYRLHTWVDPAGAFNGQWLAGALPSWPKRNLAQSLSRQPRYLSDSGKLFFDSPVALVPQDVDGQQNVYEYELGGVGGCEGAAGCVSLISSGKSGQESALIDASASGDDVFFVTSSRLVAQDGDKSYDMYDAHACSASVPCLAPSPVSPPPCETGDSCKPAPTPQPAAFGTPASATFSGAGNVVPSVSKPVAKKKKPTKCARGKKLSHGKCVKRSKATRKSARGRK